MWDNPTSIVFGVRHKKRFGFLDNAGEILDTVIELQEAGELPFPQGVMFEEIGWQKLSAQMKDNRGTVSVEFNPDGLVLTVDPTRSRLTRESAKRLLLALARQVLPMTGGDDRVERVGTVESYRFDHDASGDAAVAAITNLAPLGNAADVAIRLSFRSATEEGLVRRDVQDWRNTIIQVWNRPNEVAEPDLNHLHVGIDYQSYFVPARQYAPNLVEEHHRRFMERLEMLQSGRLAGLAGDQVAR